MKILFYGFRHGHIEGLLQSARANSRVQVVACIEEDDDSRKSVEERLGVQFDDRAYEEWLQADVDVVAIGGRYADRGQAIIKALKAGKHIIADKPICTKIEEYEEIARLSKEKNLKIQCMFDLRYMPSAKRAKELFLSGEMGGVRNISFTGQHYLNYGNRPAWYFEEGMHGGTLNDLAIHGVDLITHLTGLCMQEINAARCWNAYAIQEKHFKDCATYMATLNNGAGVLADISYSAPPLVYATDIYWNFKFWCDNGLVTFSFKDPNVKVYKLGEKEPIILEGIIDSKNYLDDFLDEIEDNTNAITESVLYTTYQTLFLQSKAK
ncbi:MAG: Gfo/Idh/MocA family oxidoreductase [Clostridia bacterium]|nr:Gfo/Idh/MocA family oxidoreductase [Clostridia bacterium]